MLRLLLTLISMLFLTSTFSQDKKQPISQTYWEDQLYVCVNYNVLHQKPNFAVDSDFSYGLSGGYIKDIPFHKAGKWSSGIGVGYNFESYNYKFDIIEDVLIPTDSYNKLYLHSIEFPIQFRWRNSDIQTYSFWRIYLGIKLSYNLINYHKSDLSTLKNIDFYNKFQYGLSLSAGYSTFNAYLYYGLNPVFSGNQDKSYNIYTTNFGLIFYLL